MTALWLASIIGAALFFASGVLSAEVLQRLLGIEARSAPLLASSGATAPMPVSEPPRASAPGEDAAAPDDRSRFAAFAANEVAQARAAARAHRMEAEALRQQLDVEISTKAAIDLELGQSRAREEDTSRRLAETQRAAALVPTLEKRVAELSAYAEENAALRSERDALRHEVERLRRSTRDALSQPKAPATRVQVDLAARTSITRSSRSGTTRRAHESENTLEAGLQRHLSGLRAREPGVIAVLSDDNGFPVAAVGGDEHQEGVSVLSSLAQELAFRVKEFVDLERIERLELADTAGRALRVRLFDWEAQPLALACLGKRSLIANPDEELVVTAFPKLLRRAWSA